jgi:hypothetical protein
VSTLPSRPAAARLALAGLLAAGLASAGPAAAGDSAAAPAAADEDPGARARRMTQAAVDAARESRWTEAQELAETVLTLDDGPATAEARVVLARSLEVRGQHQSALYEIRQYLALPLPMEQLERG